MQNGQKKAEDQYPKLIFDLEDQYLLLLEDQYPKSSLGILILQEKMILILQIKNEFGILILGIFLAIWQSALFFQQASREGSDQKIFSPREPSFKLDHSG